MAKTDKPVKVDKDIEKQLKLIGARLKEYRKKKHSSYDTFAYENDLNRAQYGRYENGRDLRVSTLLKLFKALKINPKEFFSKEFE